jgi:peptide/nickel transport system permease protein
LTTWDSNLWHLAYWYRQADSPRAISQAEEKRHVSIFSPRLLISVPVLLGISIVLFSILALAPGDPFSELALNPNVPPEVRFNLRKQFGLDDPLAMRYFRWLASMLRGDWGYSFVSRLPVQQLILQRLLTTLFVLGSAFVLALLIALPVGILSAVKPTRSSISWPRLCIYWLFAPDVFTGLLFILVFSIYLDWLPFIYSSTIEATASTVLEHLRQGSCHRRAWLV